MRRPGKILLRLLLGVGAPAGVILICALVRSGRLSVPCVFYTATGLYCPGCGSGRALYALLHGRLGEAFSQNPLLFILGIPAGAVLVYEYLRLVFPGLRLRPFYVPQAAAVVCVILVFVFWIARNLPWFSFLAPGG